MTHREPASVPQRGALRALQAVVLRAPAIKRALEVINMATRATGCICGRHLLEDLNEGTCLLCGHGDADVIVELAYRHTMQERMSVATIPPPTPTGLAAVVAGWDEDDCIQAACAWRDEHGYLPFSSDWQAPRRPGEHRPSYNTVHRLFGTWPAFIAATAQRQRQAVAA